MQIGYGKLTEQKDGLFAGGSEIYWHGANAVLTSPSDTQPTLQPIKIKYSFSRSDIRNTRWKTIFSLFDQDWSTYEVSRELMVIEGDGDPKIKKFGIEVEVAKVGSIGFEIENFEVDNNMDSRKETLFHNWLERDIFFVDNNNNDGHGLKGGYKIWHADHLYWTMPVTDINY